MAKPKSPAAGQQLTVQRRTAIGTRPTRRLRAGAQIPGVVYGHQMEPLAIAVDLAALGKLLHSKTGEHSLVTLRLEDPPTPPEAASARQSPKPWERPALVKAVQHDPVDGHVVHVDFQAITLTERIRVKIPVALTGEPVGVKQEGGVLEQFLRELEVECLPTEIPAGIEYDVSALKIGDTVHVKDLPAPPQAKVLAEAAGVVASVKAPKVEKPEEAAAAPAEPEVIREKKPEAEEAAAEEAPKKEKAEARPGASEGRAGAPAPKADEKRKAGA
ncbi:MAG: 50S ribosomal protein L25 [Candidatus Omnitrophica bacterium]|nr:50S ribosomal protein L25 [Candidatus Omnitrophota bacterium]